MPLFSKGNQASSDEAILAIAVAEPTLSSSLQLTSTGKAGLTYKPASGDAFAELEEEVQGLLHSGQQNTGTRYTVETDEYGYRWVLLGDEQFEDLAMGLYVVGQSFFERGARDLSVGRGLPLHLPGPGGAVDLYAQARHILSLRSHSADASAATMSWSWNWRPRSRSTCLWRSGWSSGSRCGEPRSRRFSARRIPLRRQPCLDILRVTYG